MLGLTVRSSSAWILVAALAIGCGGNGKGGGGAGGVNSTGGSSGGLYGTRGRPGTGDAAGAGGAV